MVKNKLTAAEFRIIPMLPKHIQAVSDLHSVCIPDTVPAKLGHNFLASLYRSLLSDPDTLCVVALNHSNKVIGVITATSDLRKTLDRQQRLILSPAILWKLLVACVCGKIRVTDIFMRLQFEKFLIHLTQSSYATILTLFVDPEYRRHGVGRLLIRHASQRPGKSVHALHVDTRSDNASAISLYRKTGFTIVSRRSHYVVMVNRMF
jgi:ribosomal protein S18 acetylase RimI-like enzyme